MGGSQRRCARIGSVSRAAFISGQYYIRIVMALLGEIGGHVHGKSYMIRCTSYSSVQQRLFNYPRPRHHPGLHRVQSLCPPCELYVFLGQQGLTVSYRIIDTSQTDYLLFSFVRKWPYRVLPLIPCHAFIQFHTVSSKAVQRTPNREIDLSATKSLYQIQIPQMSPAPSVGNRNRTPLRQLLHQLLIDAALQAFVISSMNEKLGAVWLQRLDRLCEKSQSKIIQKKKKTL